MAKKPLDFNFEDAWKAEGTSGNPVNPNQNQGVRPQQPMQQQPKNPMMNNVQPNNQPMMNPMNPNRPQ
jgi:hypothetical protein